MTPNRWLTRRSGVWYASLMPARLPKEAIKSARAAVSNAERGRKFHARRTDKDSPQRKADIDLALERLKEAMLPLRSEIGRFPYGPQTAEAEDNRQIIRAASEHIQRERRKLWKLKQRR